MTGCNNTTGNMSYISSHFTHSQHSLYYPLCSHFSIIILIFSGVHTTKVDGHLGLMNTRSFKIVINLKYRMYRTTLFSCKDERTNKVLLLLLLLFILFIFLICTEQQVTGS